MQDTVSVQGMPELKQRIDGLLRGKSPLSRATLLVVTVGLSFWVELRAVDTVLQLDQDYVSAAGRRATLSESVCSTRISTGALKGGSGQPFVHSA